MAVDDLAVAKRDQPGNEVTENLCAKPGLSSTFTLAILNEGLVSDKPTKIFF